MKLLLATNNKHKLIELQSILGQKIELSNPSQEGILFEVDETGVTFEENAKLKSEHLYKLSNLPSLADDSGIVVEALQGEPGVYSARFGKPEFNDKDRALYLLEKMKDQENRNAHYYCAISFTDSTGTYFFSDVCKGKIEFDYDNTGNGFGYDPVFTSFELNKRFSQVNLEEKNKVSHRSKALLKFVEFFQKHTFS
jgi:XTP/dITP diphosphohydrolase